MPGSIVVAARVKRATEAMVEERLRALVDFYEVLGGGAASRRLIDPLRLLIAEIDLAGGARDLSAPICWGGSLPEDLQGTGALLRASDADLRRLDEGVAVLAAGPERACLVTGPGPPTALYGARSEEVDAWSTHAVAAAWLAFGEVRVDWSGAPVQVATGYVGGEETFVAGARAIPAATRITLDSGGSHETTYWAPEDRWRSLPVDQAQHHGERHLLEALERKTSAFARPYVGLTAGLDSRVVAAGLRELGIEFATLTWGNPADAEVSGGRAAASALGVSHRACPFEWWGDADAIRGALAEARWNEGAGFVIGKPSLPRDIGGSVNGIGGETGRAFYYKGDAHLSRQPTPRELTDVFMRRFDSRLGGARRQAVRSVRRAVRGWVAAAEETGHVGWRCLDVVYADQRLQRWARGNLPFEPRHVVRGLTAPEVQRALISQPLEDRIAGRFHARFLERRAPALAPAARPGDPRPAPRLPRLRAAIRAGRSRLRRPAADDAGPLPMSPWRDRPVCREWISEQVLHHPMIVETLGERWTERVRTGWELDPESMLLAFRVAGPVALERALEDLNCSEARVRS